MTVYNLREHGLNFSGILRFCFQDEASNFTANIGNIDNFKHSKYKAILLGNTEANEANLILKTSNQSKCVIRYIEVIFGDHSKYHGLMVK